VNHHDDELSMTTYTLRVYVEALLSYYRLPVNRVYDYLNMLRLDGDAYCDGRLEGYVQ
jgi:hypothetical protein